MTPLRSLEASRGGLPHRSPPGTVRETRTFDARGQILGRLATAIAHVLRGKDQPTWVPYRDTGATVIVTNTDVIRVTGEKLVKKLLFRHTQRKPGAFRIKTLEQRLERDSREVVRTAVWNMLPKNRLRHRMITRLTLYKGEAPSTSSTQ
jgi:large subunit ribosomal protein L13